MAKKPTYEELEQRVKELEKIYAQLHRAEEALRRRDTIVGVLSTTAERFLRATSLEEGNVQEILAQLGQATNVSRIYVFENHIGDDGTHLTSQRYEWVSSGIMSQMDNPDLYNFPWRAGGMGRWEKTLRQGQLIQGYVREFPTSEQEILVPQNIQSIVALPIFVEEKWWGFIGFDECKEEREWSPAEIDALKTAGTILGALIERKRAEEGLKESEEKCRSLVDSTKDSIYLLDRNCTYLFTNKNHLSRLGVGKGIGRNYSEFHFEDDSRELVGKVEKVFKTGKSLGYEYRSQRDGRYFIRTLSPVKGSDKKTISVTVVSKDITERKQAEEMLQFERQQLLSIFDSINEIIYVTDPNTYEILYANKTLRDAFQKSLVGGICYREFQGLESPCEFCTNEIILKEKYKPYRWEHHNPVLDRDYIVVDRLIKWPDGRDVRFELALDITHRKQAEDELKNSEERYRTLVESSTDAILMMDKERRIVSFNHAFLDLFGYKKDELIGESIGIIHESDDSFHSFGQKAYPVIKKVSFFMSEWAFMRKDGTVLPVETVTSAIKAPDGSITGYVAIIRDITEKKKVEEERKKLETQLLQAQKMETIGILAGGVAHDLNNILSGIISYPELLLLDLPEDSHLRKPLLTIKSSGEKAAVVVQDLLTLARRGVISTEIVNLNSIISEQLKSLECENLKTFHSNVDIKTNLEKDLLNIKGSTAHLGKTVMNLVSNAAEAMPDGGKVLISTENLYIDRPIRGYDQVDEGDYVVVTVIDTGIGISEEDIERIFEPFYTKKVMGRSGSGLGMSVVWGTVKDHNGYIDVESTKGKGTTFTLYFPVTREELAIDKSLISIEDYMGKGESILIVDDVEEQRDIASVMLKKLGYSVTSVSSGEEAIEYMKDNSVDLLLLDMIMDPGIDGLETYKRILKLHPKQKAIIASGFSETDRVKKAKKLGAGAYVKKPYVLEKIGLVIKEELEK